MNQSQLRTAAILCVLVAAQVLLHGCSSSSMTPASRVASRSSGDARRDFASPFVAEIPALVLSSKYDLQLYDASGREFKAIRVHGYQGAIALEKQGDIYYDNYLEYNNRVLIFQPPYTAKPKILSHPFYGVGYTRGIAIDWKTGVFSVMTDAINYIPGSYSALWFFRHGATTPCAVLEEPSGWAWAGTAAFDANGTLFTVGSGGDGATVVSAAGQCDAKRIVTYSPVLRNALRAQFNLKNQLVVEESTGFSNSYIVTFPHPANGQLGNPLTVTTLQNINGDRTAMLTLTSSGSQLWASNFKDSIGLYDYPQGGAPIAVMNASEIGDAAVYPQLMP